MATRGRKPKPTKLRVVGGNAGKRALNKKEPKPEAHLPDPPDFLSEEALEEWQRVAAEMYDLGLLSKIDRAAFAAYCQAYGRWRQAEEALGKLAAKDKTASGLMIKTKNGNAIQNPLVGTANRAMADAMRLAAEFGMTPSSRSRIDTDKARQAQQADKAEEYFSTG